MGNAFGPREWKLDTTGTISIDKIRVRHMEWIPNAAGDDLLVSNSAGDVIWEVTNALAAALAGKEQTDWKKPHDIEGFVLTTLGGGTLYVWLD